MPLRLAQYSDLAAISSVFASAFHEEELHAYLFPHRCEYPEDYVGAWHQKVEQRWWDFSRVFVVSYDETGAITGAAEWQRTGKGWEDVWGSGWWDLRTYLSPLLALKAHFTSAIKDKASIHATPSNPNPLTHHNFESRIGPFMTQFYPPSRRQYWELATLGTAPAYRRRGIGRSLVGWGLARARQEGVPAVVIVAKGLESFYRSCGFVELVGWASQAEVEGLVNPLKERGIGGGAVMWTKVDGEEPVDVSVKPED